MPQEDVYKVSMFYHTSQKQMIATHYYEAGAQNPTDPFEEPEALAQAWGSAFGGPYALALSAGAQIGCIKIEQVKGAGLPTFVSFFEDLRGLRAADPIAANLAGIIRRRGIFLAKPRRSLIFLGGIAEADTEGSFLENTYVTGPMFDLLELYNDILTSQSQFQLATWNPVMPHTPMVYARNIPVIADTSANTLTLTDGTTWSERGFITGPKFSVAAPSKNRGTYTASIVPFNVAVALSENELELDGPETIDVQQATADTSYFTLQSAVVNTAIRQLNRRRSSHTGIVA